VITEMEARVRQAIVKTCGLDVERVHLDAGLAELGVDSLDAAEILVDLEIQLGRSFPIDILRRLDQAATVRSIAAQLESEFDSST
jgi:acyl carrier protein